MKCILHIGPSRTGSTSIQAFLKINEKKLSNSGMQLINLSHTNMSELRIAFFDKYKPSNTDKRLKVNEENFFKKKKDFRESIANKLIKAKETGKDTVIISSEGITGIGRPYQGSENKIKELANWLLNYVDEVNIIPVLRRPDLRALSRYKNMVKNHGFCERNCLIHAHTMDLELYLSKWIDAFGKENIKPILFPDSVPEKRILIEDFCEVTGIKKLNNKIKIEDIRRNASYDGRAIEIMRQMNNIQIKQQLGSNKLLRNFQKVMQNYYCSPDNLPIQKVSPSRNEAESFCEKYESSNEKIRQIFFNDRKVLFSKDFTRYPEVSFYPKFEKKDLLNILVSLLYDEQSLEDSNGMVNQPPVPHYDAPDFQ